ncbi:acetyl-CoA C-acetyltransferase [Luteimonas sp. J16]|uniref:acetyl-CoA C-acyltransferase n=1 Tax=Luteimonas sp. J16 TaxID=935283 RepID=UPI0011A295C0|nr:acetyl-CoA C-acyltransferase [Luteimonas sp. J16]TWG94380.1 acetyl-CoA C-acetyltransferase [Luteimonas sp. J16]
MTDVFLVSAMRTAIGTFGGALRDVPPSDLGVATAKAAIAQAGVPVDAIGHAVYGQVLPSEPADAYLARVIAVKAGVPVETPAFTVNRLCGSGLQAIVSAAQALALGDCEVALAGGAESMSRTPFHLPGHRWGRKLGDDTLVDALNEGLKDPFDKVLMGITAENVAERHAIDRARQDALALESHRRAARAIAEGRFEGQIVPVTVGRRGRETVFRVDEHVRADVGADDLAGLRPVFKADGTVTAGNASGINDGAASVVLATRAALARDGLTVEDLDIVESNEAFAAQACAVADALGFDPEKTNPNGSGISLGHPVGATGAIITVKLVHELHRTGGRYGLATMCIGGGQGIAAIFERT